MAASTNPPRPAEQGGRSRRAWRSLLRDPMAVFGIAVLLLMVLTALLPPAVLPHDPYRTGLGNRFMPPVWMEGGSWTHPLGTDNLGRDLLSRIVVATRYSMLIAFSAVAISTLLGLSLGLWAGFAGGRVDALIMRLVDVQLAFPLILMVIAIAALLGPSIPVLIVLLGISGWAQFARIVRADAMSVKAREFVEASRALGNRSVAVVLRHVLPNIATSALIFGTFEFARVLLVESSVSFLGLGIQPPTPSWGTMVANGRNHIFGGWWVATMPGLSIVIAVLAFNFVGDGLKDALDPRSQARKERDTPLT